MEDLSRCGAWAWWTLLAMVFLVPVAAGQGEMAAGQLRIETFNGASSGNLTAPHVEIGRASLSFLVRCDPAFAQAEPVPFHVDVHDHPLLASAEVEPNPVMFSWSDPVCPGGAVGLEAAVSFRLADLAPYGTPVEMQATVSSDHAVNDMSTEWVEAIGFTGTATVTATPAMDVATQRSNEFEILIQNEANADLMATAELAEEPPSGWRVSMPGPTVVGTQYDGVNSGLGQLIGSVIPGTAGEETLVFRVLVAHPEDGRPPLVDEEVRITMVSDPDFEPSEVARRDTTRDGPAPGALLVVLGVMGWACARRARG